ERNPAALVELHALLFETMPLKDICRTRTRARADPAFGIHNPMPWDGSPAAERVQRITHEAGMTGHAGQAGDLAICRYAPPGNARDNGINITICTCFFRHESKATDEKVPHNLLTFGSLIFKHPSGQSLKINIPAFHIRADQLHTQPVADVHTFEAL